MRRRLSFAFAALALAAPLAAAATIHGCSSDPEFESVCLWVSDPDNCYRKFREDAEVAGQTCKPIGNPTPVGADPANPLGVSNGSFISRSALDVCFMAGGGSVVIDPPIDLLNYPPPLLSTPITYTFTFLDDRGAECGAATYTSPHGFSFTINPPPDAGAAADAGAANAGDAGDAGTPLPYGTFTQVIPAGGDAFDSTCPSGETHHFNLVEVSGASLVSTTDGGSNSQRTCPKFEQLVPQAAFVVNPGGIETPGAVSFTIFWPKVDNDAAYTKDAAGVLIQTGTPIVPDAITYFNCSIGGAPKTCNNASKDPNETDVDCGGVEISPNCPARCGDGQLCVGDCDCDPALQCLVVEGVKKCAAPSGGAAGAPPVSAPPRDCSSVIICQNKKQDGAESDIDCGGPDCQGCPDGNRCGADTDCTNGYCLNLVCATATCSDGVQNQSETDVDCGGPNCMPCPEGGKCTGDTDCLSMPMAMPPAVLFCLNGVCTKPNCTDKVLDGNETDVDCGGACLGCALGLKCAVNGDCLSNACTNGVCVVSTCTDMNKNGNETDVDCGSTCPLCGDGLGCLVDSDCLNGICRLNPMSATGSTCYPPACANGAKDGMETDTDCGGGCGPCGDGQNCATGNDCLNGLCSGGVCFGAQCTNGVQDGSETAVDCGGAMCPKCGLGSACSIDGDCATLNCNPSKICTQATCNDTKIDGAETDLNCGGGTCPKCAIGKACKVGTDCVDGVCIGGVCVAGTCTDMTKNVSETGVDCGGPTCGKCAAGSQCSVGTDCLDGVCSGGMCTAPACGDGVKNGVETDTDCGNGCPKCGFNKSCGVNADCLSNICMGMVCAASCNDGSKNNMETDVDCGGNCAPLLKCAFMKACNAPTDCIGGVCTANLCAASCTDTVKNGTETDIDCGGSCGGCGPGKNCTANGDCTSGTCQGTQCL